MHRFIGDFNLKSKKVEITDPKIIHQIINVLRLRVGENVVLCNSKLQEALCRITVIDSKSISLEIIGSMYNKNEPRNYIILYSPVLKRDNLEWVVQKATEVGVCEIVPVITGRTVKFGVRLDRLIAIAREAAEQSGRGVVPYIHEPMSFKEALAHSLQNEGNVFFHQDSPLFKADQFSKTKNKKMGIFVGPEGGWDARELKVIISEARNKKRYYVRSLGRLTLRAETAAVVACYLFASL